MICPDILAGSGEEALTVGTGALGHLLFTGREPEVGSRTADIVDIALEIGIFDHDFGFFDNGFMGTGLHDSALMEGQCTERTGTETAAVADQTEFDLFDGGNAAESLIAGMIIPAVGKIIHGVHFFRGQRLLRGVLHHHQTMLIGFRQTLGGEWVAVRILHLEGFGIDPLVVQNFLIGGENNGGQAVIQIVGLEHGAVDVGDVLDIQTGVQSVGDFHHAALTHAVHQQVGLRVQKNGALHAVRQIVIVAQTAQAGLDAADQNRHILIGLADQITVDHGGIVRTLAHDAAGGVGIGFAVMLGNGIMVDHGINVAAGDQETQTGTAVDINGFGIFPVGLGNDAHGVAVAFQNPADNGMTERRVIDIRVTDYIYKIALFPAAIQHVLPANGKKVHEGDLQKYNLLSV